MKQYQTSAANSTGKGADTVAQSDAQSLHKGDLGRETREASIDQISDFAQISLPGKLLTICGSFIIMLAAVCCTVGALITAFSFEADARTLFTIWAIVSLLLAVSATLLRGKGILLLIVPALIILYMRIQPVVEGAKWAAFAITREYNKWLYVSVMFPDAQASAHEQTLFFAFMGIVLAFLLAVAVCRMRSAFAAILVTAPFAFLTIVLTESTPDVRFFLGLIAVYLALLISAALNPDNYIKMGKNVFPAIALSMLVLGAAYLIAPQGNYSRGSFINNMGRFVRNTAERVGLEMNRKGIGWPGRPGIGEWRFNTEYVGIANSGSRLISDRKLLEVTSSKAGTFYLRGFSMHRFNGREWSGNVTSLQHPDRFLSDVMPAIIAESYEHLFPGALPPANMIINRVADASDIVYRPYHTYGFLDFSDPNRYLEEYYDIPVLLVDSDPYMVNFYHAGDGGILSAYDLLSQSDFPLSEPSEQDWYVYGEGSYLVAQFIPSQDTGDFIRTPASPRLRNYNGAAQAPYTQIDTSTARQLRALAIEAGIDPDAGRAEIADAVAEFVSSSARYVLNPYVVPVDEDFAVYFLQTSKRGYCIHFATAAALMLRALDVPARFTSGFVVTIPSDVVGSAVAVTDREAHAWVEVYYEDVGWLPLEVTPSISGSGIPERVPHTAVAPVVPVVERRDPSEGYLDDSWMDYIDEYERELYNRPEPGSRPQQGREEEVSNSGWFGTVLIVVLCIGVCVAAFVFRREFARKTWRKRFNQPDTNAAVVQAWRYISHINLKDKPLGELEEVALKARYSQHRISEDERDFVLSKVFELSAAFYDYYSWKWKFWLKFVRGLQV